MFHIITDSASDIPQDIIDRYKLHVIPTPVVINNKDYLDGVDILPDQFYDLLDNMENNIRTYHINPMMFNEAFLPYAKVGDSVLYICFSTGIAGTFNAANIAMNEIKEDYPDFDIHIVDSKAASVGIGLIVYYLLMMKENGAPQTLLIEAANAFAGEVQHIFTVNTLEYLIKGGRLSKMKGIIGTVLDLRPIITVDDGGRLTVLKTVRGRKRSLNELMEYIESFHVNLTDKIIAICSAGDEETLSAVKETLENKFHPKGFLQGKIGCAIGAHTGRGLIGIGFINSIDERFTKYFS